MADPAPIPDWLTPQVQKLIEQWIAVAEAKLNSYNGGREFNSRKPWRINKYGLLEAENPTIRSAYEPDDFSRYGNNRLWWVWEHYRMVPDPATFGMKWPDPNWNKAGVPDLKTFVEDGLAGRTK